MPRQKLGQHFLASEAWRSRIQDELGPASDETCLEIGAGHGEMTEHLAQLAPRVIAVETDARLAALLRERARDWPGVEVLRRDVLGLDLLRAAGPRFRVYGNLPYYITSPILHHLFRFAAHVSRIHVVIQHEVALRAAARPGTSAFGYLSAACRFYTHPEIVLAIPADAFQPPPEVNSALLGMSLPGERAHLAVRDEAAFLKFVQLCFGQKRKTLRNNLRTVFPVEHSAAALAACAIPPGARAEQLQLAQFAALFQELQ